MDCFRYILMFLFGNRDAMFFHHRKTLEPKYSFDITEELPVESDTDVRNESETDEGVD